MVALSLLSLLLATAALAIPTPRDNTIHGAGNVPTSAVTLPQSFTPMSSSPNIVLVGIGSQNYTCNSEGTYDYVGAFAQMYDISAYLSTEESATISVEAYNNWNPSYWLYDLSVNVTEMISLNITIYGTFYSTQQNGVLTPVWDLTYIGSSESTTDLNGIIYGQEVISAPSTNGTDNTNWAEFQTSSSEWGTTVYSVDTVGGQPPSSCTPGSNENFQYAATYYWCV